MSVWLKVLLGALGGFALGFASGALVVKKLNDIQFEEVSEEDLDKLLEDMGGEMKNLSSGGAEVAKKASDGLEKVLNEAAKGDVDKTRMAAQGKTPFIRADDAKKQEYSKMWDTVKDYSNEENANDIPTEDNETEDSDENFLQTLADEIVDEVEDPDINKEPYQITLGEFYEDHRNFDKVTIDWYDGDNVVLDEQENVVDDVVGYVGCRMDKLFGEAPLDGDPDSRFIRNERYGTDDEVIRHHKSWKNVSGE